MRTWGNLLMRKNGDHTLEVPKFEGDIENQQLVGSHGESIVVQMPKLEMTPHEALVHAAWLVGVADKSENFAEFRGILKAVLET